MMFSREVMSLKVTLTRYFVTLALTIPKLRIFKILGVDIKVAQVNMGPWNLYPDLQRLNSF
jgi:hypothetical protein